MVNIQKAAVIGCGFVGSTIAYSFMQRGIFSEMVLIDANQSKAEGEAMDLSHGLPFVHAMDIYAGGYEDIRDAALIVITAGANQKPGESRTDLVQKNTEIMKTIISQIKRAECEGILLVVSNPVDILTYVAWKESGFAKERVLGSGTVLDTARLKYLLSGELKVDSRKVHAFIIGEHGDSELAVWSSANISGIDLDHFSALRGERTGKKSWEEIYMEVRDSAYEIIEKKGATYYGIGTAVGRIAECIVRDGHAVLPVSVLLEGEYGLCDLCLSIPTVVGQKGAEQVLEIELDEKEKQQLEESAKEINRILAQIVETILPVEK